jgi:hypothetical protein
MERAIRSGLNPERLHLLEGSTDDIRADLEERGRVTLHARNFAQRRAPQAGQAGPKNAGARLEENYF